MSDRPRRRRLDERRPRRRRPAGRRRSPRWQVTGGRLNGAVITASVIDLGPAGARVETAEALRVGATYAFTLELAGASRRLRGRVCWCRLIGTREAAEGERSPIYRAGIVWADRPPPELAGAAPAGPEPTPEGQP